MQVRVLMTTIVVLMMSLTSLSGCFGNDDEPEIEEEFSPFSFENAIPMTTWYHYAGGMRSTKARFRQQISLQT